MSDKFINVKGAKYKIVGKVFSTFKWDKSHLNNFVVCCSLYLGKPVVGGSAGVLSQTFEGFVHLAQSLPLPDGGHGPAVQDSPHPLAGPAGPDQALRFPAVLVVVDHEVLEVRVPHAVVIVLRRDCPGAGHL